MSQEKTPIEKEKTAMGSKSNGHCLQFDYPFPRNYGLANSNSAMGQFAPIYQLEQDSNKAASNPANSPSGVNMDMLESTTSNIDLVGDLIGGVTELFLKEGSNIIAKASEIIAESGRLKQRAQKTMESASKLIKIAGSGSSFQRSRAAGTAVREAQRLEKLAADTLQKGLRLQETATGVFKALPKLVKVLQSIPLDQIGAAAVAINKYLTTTNVTTTGKVADAALTSALDYYLGKKNPLLAAADAIIGLFPGGDKVNISSTASNSSTAITGSIESVVTGDTKGIDDFHQKSKNGENSWLFKNAADWGDRRLKDQDITDRVEKTGDYWGGADSVGGRIGAFSAAIPGLGQAGEFLGKSAAKLAIAQHPIVGLFR